MKVGDLLIWKYQGYEGSEGTAVVKSISIHNTIVLKWIEGNGSVVWVMKQLMHNINMYKVLHIPNCPVIKAFYVL